MSKKFTMTATHWVLIIALLVCGYASFLLVAPYLNAIIIAFILSLLMAPLHKRLLTKFPNWKNTMAMVSCVLLVLIIVLPLVAIFSGIVAEGASFSQAAYKWMNSGGVQKIIDHEYVRLVFRLINEYLPFVELDLASIAQKGAQHLSQVGTYVVQIGAGILNNASSFIMSCFLMLFVLFFLLRDQDKIFETLRHILPFSRTQEDRLIKEIESVSKSAILGSFLTAIAQGFAGGIALWVVGLPALFWGTMMGVASFIPVIGTALIWIPVTLYLFLTGDVTWAIIFAIWSIVVIGSIDNILRPLLMKGSAGMDTLLVFFSLLGGIQLFGLAGLIYGPLIFALTIVIYKMYEEAFKDFLDYQDKN